MASLRTGRRRSACRRTCSARCSNILPRSRARRSRRLRRGRWRGVCTRIRGSRSGMCAARTACWWWSPRRRGSWCRRSSAATWARRWWRSRRFWPSMGSSARFPVWPGCCARGCIWARSTSASCTTSTLTRRSSRIAGCLSGWRGGTVSRGRQAKSERLLARLGVLRCGTCASRMVINSDSGLRGVSNTG